MLKSTPSLYLDEYREWFELTTHKNIDVATICRYLIRMGFTRQRLSIIAYERDQLQSLQFWRIINQFPVHMLMFVDETSKDDRTANRRYGYFPSGERQPATLGHFIRKHRISVMAALDINGISSISIVEGSYNTDLFNFSFKSFSWTKLVRFLTVKTVQLLCWTTAVYTTVMSSYK